MILARCTVRLACCGDALCCVNALLGVLVVIDPVLSSFGSAAFCNILWSRWLEGLLGSLLMA